MPRYVFSCFRSMTSMWLIVYTSWTESLLTTIGCREPQPQPALGKQLIFVHMLLNSITEPGVWWQWRQDQRFSLSTTPSFHWNHYWNLLLSSLLTHPTLYLRTLIVHIYHGESRHFWTPRQGSSSKIGHRRETWVLAEHATAILQDNTGPNSAITVFTRVRYGPWWGWVEKW